ncbi:MAG: hypothetical protein QW201_02980, partial [Thermoproteota archaeon]
TGETCSEDFPAENAYQRERSGFGCDAFIAKLIEVISYGFLELKKGWNFISFPRLPQDPSITSVLKTKDVKVIWGYDNVNKRWLSWKPNITSSTLTAFESGKGYWIYMNRARLMDMSNWTGGSSTVPLYEGWNLIGWNGADGVPVMDALYTLGDKWEIIWGWENGKWKAKKRGADSIPGIEPLCVLNQGRAYWIKMNVNATWSQ